MKKVILCHKRSDFSKRDLKKYAFDFVWVESLCPSQQFFSHVRIFSWVKPVHVLSNEDEVSCSRTQHTTLGEIRTRDLAFDIIPVQTVIISDLIEGVNGVY